MIKALITDGDTFASSRFRTSVTGLEIFEFPSLLDFPDKIKGGTVLDAGLVEIGVSAPTEWDRETLKQMMVRKSPAVQRYLGFILGMAGFSEFPVWWDSARRSHEVICT